jgi:hypothetical protein
MTPVRLCEETAGVALRLCETGEGRGEARSAKDGPAA